MKNLKISIIGAGTAGLSAATFLQENGNHVTLYEKFEHPKPIGAGLLIQPTGLAVLAKLGLDQHIINTGSRIDRLYGKVAHKRSSTLEVHYRDFASHLFGVGTHRGNLFSALYEKAIATGVNIIPNSNITTVDDFQVADMIIDASGTGSVLRDQYADVKRDRSYPFGAVWSIVEIDTNVFQLDTLEQRYKRAYHMIGILPVGKSAKTGKELAAFFWSMKTKDYAAWREQDFREWQDYVISLWPETKSVVEQFTSHDDLMFANYRDVVLRKYYTDNIVFIGDSAHCTSPQLGQGANLALVDALVLSESIAESESVSQALMLYEKRRRKHINFYQTASRFLTPFFQSDSLFFAKLRFFTCDLTCKISITRRIAAQVLTGTKTGLFSSLNPGRWASDYTLRK
ncbi:MAG: NAD(P)/FAD-dependent oxidoreductase [Rickettsiales bacterium]|nr:NAD(P)/FAD-dependent oxidoreductase [Rickettsiales bacterium]